MPKETFFNLPMNKKERIIDAAYDLFIKKSYKEITIREIVKNAGISIGSFYQYFYNKDDLYLYLIAEIEKKIYNEYKKRAGKFLTDAIIIPIEEICSPKEIEFSYTWYKAPIEVMVKFYFGEYAKEMNKIVWDELVEMKEANQLVNDFDLEFIFYLYVTTMFNIIMYFKVKNITDERERFKLKRKFYMKWFVDRIVKKDSNQLLHT